MVQVVVILLGTFTSALLISLMQVQGGHPTIDPNLDQATLNGATRFNIFVTMRNGTEPVLNQISTNAVFKNAGNRRQVLYTSLRQHARESQASLMSELEQHATVARAAQEEDFEMKSFWITNQIYIRNADLNILNLLRERDDVVRIDMEVKVIVDMATEQYRDFRGSIPLILPYNLEMINVGEVWANNVNGSGIVVAHIDTGVRATHDALRDNYKNDRFSWYDPLEKSKEAFDGHGHGTMTMGALAGGMDIGVAFGAKWIACRGLGWNGNGDVDHLLECGQFILCPTTPDGKESDCSQAPHVVCNGWNSNDQYATWYLDVINAWRVAGIIPIWSAGNYGGREASCQSLGSHAPSPDVIAVGATNEEDALWSESSHGPSVLDERIIKPEITAPGVGILSTTSASNNGYGFRSGTSMAASQVAGVVALLLSMDPKLEYDDIKHILESTANKHLIFAGKECDARPDNEFPNFQFGHGRLDAYAAYLCVKNDYECLEKEDTTTTMDPTEQSTKDSTTERPTTTEEPIMEESTTKEPTTEEATPKEPITEKSTPKEPTTEEATTSTITITSTTTEEPTTSTTITTITTPTTTTTELTTTTASTTPSTTTTTTTSTTTTTPTTTTTTTTTNTPTTITNSEPSTTDEPTTSSFAVVTRNKWTLLTYGWFEAILITTLLTSF